MPKDNLLEYSDNYPMTSGSLQNYYTYETDDVNDNASDSTSCKYKAKIKRKTEARSSQSGD